MKRFVTILAAVTMVLILDGCVKPFNPVAPAMETAFLVIDGNVVPGDTTVIKLSRSYPLDDSLRSSPEGGALVVLEDDRGRSFLLEPLEPGAYGGATPSLNGAIRYRAIVQTVDGRRYESDFVEAKQTPPIDSVEWDQDELVNIYVNTHDERNLTRYYRWSYTETYENRAAFEAYMDYVDGSIVFLDDEDYRYICYTTEESTGILLGTSAALNEDRITRAPVTRVANDNRKIGHRYSILVRQYALTPEAYAFWRIVQQNSQPGGELFDPQPSQLRGNFRCVDDPAATVVGFLSASTVSEKRIFIRWGELANRTPIDYSGVCREIVIPTEMAPQYLADGVKKPAYFVGGPDQIAIVPAVCVDCRIRGGVTQKPSFW